MTNIDALLQDVRERAAVAYLKFERDVLKGHSETMRDLLRTGFIAGYEVAMYDAVKMRLGIDKDGAT